MTSESFSRGNLGFRSNRIYELINYLEKNNYFTQCYAHMLPAIRKKASEKSLQATKKQTFYDDENPETEHNYHQG